MKQYIQLLYLNEWMWPKNTEIELCQLCHLNSLVQDQIW